MSSQQSDPDSPEAGSNRSPTGSGVGYRVIQFPWPPWTLTAWMALTQAQAKDWAEWLNRTEPQRGSVISSLAERAGVALARSGAEPEEWLALGAWVYQWFPVAAAPFVDRGNAGAAQGFFQDQPEVRLGSAWAPSIPSDHGYSPSAEALLLSVAVDLATVVITSARARRPGLRWATGMSQAGGDFFLTPGTADSAGEPFELIRRIREFLVQSVARPRGSRGQQLRRWRAAELYRCYLGAVTGDAPAPEWQQFPGSNNGREGCRYSLATPLPADPDPTAGLVTAVTALRQAGWFATSKLADADLARAAATTWQAYEGEDIPVATDEVNWRLLALDCDRTWSEDVDADARPGENQHERTLFAIGKLLGKSMRSLRDAAETWAGSGGDVELSFWLSRRQRMIRLPSPRQYLSPALITGINELLPESSPRMWFAVSPSPIAVVTRATAAERDALQHLTGVTLSQAPPQWWTNLAPLPRPEEGQP
jgi:hypothetical protein